MSAMQEGEEPTYQTLSRPAYSLKAGEVIAANGFTTVAVDQAYPVIMPGKTTAQDKDCFVVQQNRSLKKVVLSELPEKQLTELVDLAAAVGLWTFKNQDGTANHLGLDEKDVLVYINAEQPNNHGPKHFMNADPKVYAHNVNVGFGELKVIMKKELEGKSDLLLQALNNLMSKNLDAIAEGNEQKVIGLGQEIAASTEQFKKIDEPMRLLVQAMKQAKEKHGLV